jgi:DNA polymerase III epsilon subunit-like protein
VYSSASRHLLLRHFHRHCRYSRARRYLAKRFLNRVIQAGDHGHDSVEDAVAAMDLALLKAANGPSFGVAEASSAVLVPSFLAEHGNKRVLVIDSSDNPFLAGTSADIVMCASSAMVFHKLADAVRQKGGAEFVVARYAASMP